MATAIYEKADRYLAYLKKLLQSEFNRYFLLGFDELNVVRVKREAKGTYSSIDEAARNRMLIVAKEAYEQAAKEVLGSEYETDVRNLPNSDWLNKVLKQYNRTTGYLYDTELDRKRLRYQEQVLTAREFQDRVMYNDSIKKAAALLWTQISQYMISTVDEARIKAFKDFGVRSVIWHTMKDGKACEDCDANNGKQFDIDNLPSKHYGCRCYLTPVVN